MLIADFTKPFYLTDEEQALAKSAMEAVVQSGVIRQKPDGSLPESAKNFADILNALAEGQSVTVISRQAELTLSQSAEFLRVSENYLIGLLDSGEIESRFLNGFRVVPMNSLIEYDVKETRRQYEALGEVIRLSQEMGLYDD